MYIPESFIERLLNSVNIVEVIQNEDKLKEEVVLIWLNAHSIKAEKKIMHL